MLFAFEWKPDGQSLLYTANTVSYKTELAPHPHRLNLSPGMLSSTDFTFGTAGGIHGFTAYK